MEKTQQPRETVREDEMYTWRKKPQINRMESIFKLIFLCWPVCMFVYGVLYIYLQMNQNKRHETKFLRQRHVGRRFAVALNKLVTRCVCAAHIAHISIADFTISTVQSPFLLLLVFSSSFCPQNLSRNLCNFRCFFFSIFSVSALWESTLWFSSLCFWAKLKLNWKLGKYLIWQWDYTFDSLRFI